jgi:hypothetical protein
MFSRDSRYHSGCNSRNRISFGMVCLAVACLPVLAHGEQASGDSRKQDPALQALYEFESIEGNLVRDLSGKSAPVHLRIEHPGHVRVTKEGLEIHKPTLLRGSESSSRIQAELKKSRSLTVEVWIKPANLNQAGPARVVTLSKNISQRNLTLGQDKDKFDVRLRTTKTDANGLPSLVSPGKTVNTDWQHVAFTCDAQGRTRLYVQGKLVEEKSPGGDFNNWDNTAEWGIGNELTQDRPWLGTIRLVAIYSRILSAEEIQKRHQQGRKLAPPTPEELQAAAIRENQHLFTARVAPLLSLHCLECHDAPNRAGGLDLSRKGTSIPAGDQGTAWVPGKPEQSLLWQLVESDAMPHDRPSLNASEKQLLRTWIAGGAEFPLEIIDPAIYLHGESSGKVYVARLTVPEYIESVRATLGVDISEAAERQLPRDIRADGFSNTTYNLTVDLAHIEAYARLAEQIVAKLDVAELARRHTKSRELTDENVTKVLNPVGRKLFRGPLSKDELTAYLGVTTSVAGAGGTFEEAIGYMLEALLQSPRFLYRMEWQRGTGQPRPLDSFELATRLAYVIWGAPPDEELLKAAEKGELDRGQVARQVDRMLQDPRAITRSRQFITEWLNLRGLDNLRPDASHFPAWRAELARDMREETLAYFEEVVWKQRQPLQALLNAQFTYVTPRLAKHYGLPITRELRAAREDQLIRYELKDVPERGGLLTQGSILTKGGDEASMVTRGLFLMHELLRGVVRDPPPCVDTTPVPSQPGLTQRMVSERRLNNTGCAGCHTKFEPLAFGLEKFDGLGTFHQRDHHGNALRDDGNILFPGSAQPVSFRNSAELMKLLAESSRVRESFTWKVIQFSLGRPLDADDAALVAEVHLDFQQQGGTYADLLRALVASDLVRTTRTEKP